MNIIKLSYEMDVLEDDEIIFYGNRVEYRKVIDDTIKLNQDFLGIKIDYKDIIEKYIETLAKKEVEEIEIELNQWNDEKLKINDYINQGYELEILEILFEQKNFLEIAAGLLDCQFGTVGYSPWSYYLALNSTDVGYVGDLYEGSNFYIIELIKDKETVDSIGNCYINNDEDLKVYVSDYFGIKEFYLVDNDEATYFKHQKIKEIKKVSYEYSL